MNQKIAEDFRTLDREQVRAALDAAYVRGYQLGVIHGERLERMRVEQQENQIFDRKGLDGLMPELPSAALTR